MKHKILFHDWGLIEYHQAWNQQEEIFKTNIDKKVKGESTENYLIFCEHPHVYTLGKSGDEHNLLINTLQLQDKSAQFVKTNRGGDITYHGPGQLVGYPIYDLHTFNLGLKDYIHQIEESIIEFLAHYQIKSERLDGATGVWLDVGKNTARKICAIGVRSSRHITMHGFALNINTDLNYFNYINPCGFVDKGVTSLAKELGEKQDMEEVKLILSEKISKIFSAEIIRLSAL